MFQTTNQINIHAGVDIIPVMGHGRPAAWVKSASVFVWWIAITRMVALNCLSHVHIVKMSLPQLKSAKKKLLLKILVFSWNKR